MQQKQFGDHLTGWLAPRRPDVALLKGRFASLERLDADSHAAGLFQANAVDDAIWDYLPYGPFAALPDYHRWLKDMAGLADPYFFAIRDSATGKLGGIASWLRITPEAGSIEVGHINLAPALQRTPAATEAMFLMMGWAFDAGYRRYEWKCNAQNLASRRAAERLGFSYEGVFRQAAVVKGRNRDTAWFAAIDQEWGALRAAYQAWLAPGNFDADGQQRQPLGDLTRQVLVSRDPALRDRPA